MYSGIKPKVRQKDYPCLMQDKEGNVYLMRKDGEGTLVYRVAESLMPFGVSKVGDISTGLFPTFLRPFLGEITLGED